MMIQWVPVLRSNHLGFWASWLPDVYFCFQIDQECRAAPMPRRPLPSSIWHCVSEFLITGAAVSLLIARSVDRDVRNASPNGLQIDEGQRVWPCLQAKKKEARGVKSKTETRGVAFL